MISQRCHNCGYKFNSTSKRKGYWCMINKFTVWFHSKSCFASWAVKYKGKYAGGLISDMK